MLGIRKIAVFWKMIVRQNTNWVIAVFYKSYVTIIDVISGIFLVFQKNLTYFNMFEHKRFQLAP